MEQRREFRRQLCKRHASGETGGAGRESTLNCAGGKYCRKQQRVCHGSTACGVSRSRLRRTRLGAFAADDSGVSQTRLHAASAALGFQGQWDKRSVRARAGAGGRPTSRGRKDVVEVRAVRQMGRARGKG